MAIDLDDKTRAEMLQEYVHRLEHALCYFRFPHHWAQMDNDEFYATAIEAEMNHRYRSTRGKE